MNPTSMSILPRARMNQRGQILPLVAVSLAAVFGMTAIVYDIGVTYFSYSELQSSTNAAALAGAEAMAQPGATSATVSAAVTSYSGVSGNKNANINLPGVSLVTSYNPKLYCSTKLQTVFGSECVGAGSANALVVEQQVSVPMTFAKYFGASSVLLTATASAAMRGANSGPFNVVVLMDSTQSMNDIQSYADCNGKSALSCALSGVQILLQNLSPCAPTLTSCGTATANSSGGGANVSNSVDRVSLLTFPPVLGTSAPKDYCGTGTTLTTEPYAIPFPSTSTYQIVNFSSDYRASDTTTTLNTSSNIVQAVAGKSGCAGLQALGGQGTFYAQAVYQAQAYLVAEQAAILSATGVHSQNVLIILSDGDATATCSKSGDPCPASGGGPMTGAYTTRADLTAHPPSATVTNVYNECQQAVTAAQAAWAAGTTVYAVNFGAEASGCTNDSPTIAPCQTMLQMATNPAIGTSSTYFSDDPSGGTSSCATYARPTTTLDQIFQAIAGDLTVAKLIPNNTP